MEEKFEPITHTISNMQLGNTSALEAGKEPASIVREDVIVAKRDSDVIKPFIPKDDTTVPNVVASYQQIMDCDQIELSETTPDYNDIEIPRSK